MSPARHTHQDRVHVNAQGGIIGRSPTTALERLARVPWSGNEQATNRVARY
jgi:hypothetical protein